LQSHVEDIMLAEYRPAEISSGTVESFDLVQIAKDLMEDEVFRKSGRVARTLARGDQMSAIVTVIRKGTEIHEHTAPGPVSVQVLSGEIVVSVDSQKVEVSLPAGTAVILSADSGHRVSAKENSAFFLLIGGRS
jgi:quercetin dioxygenase-like cupin family protein